MKFTISKAELLKPLQLVGGVVDKTHSTPILANLLLEGQQQQLKIIGTDQEIELETTLAISSSISAKTAVTIPARKFVDVVRSLPDATTIEISWDVNTNKAIVKASKSKFCLATLPAEEFPRTETLPAQQEFSVYIKQLRQLIERVQFSMAQQDLRYFLNGMLLTLTSGELSAVATDGHRLAVAKMQTEVNPSINMQAIIPRKCVLEIIRLLQEDDGMVDIALAAQQLKLTTASLTLYSRLVEGKFPNYSAVLPSDRPHHLVANTQNLKQALQRAIVLFTEKYQGVRFVLGANELQLSAANMEQEEVNEILEVEYSGPEMSLGLNVKYLLEILQVVNAPTVTLQFKDPSSSIRIDFIQNDIASNYVVMPMKI